MYEFDDLCDSLKKKIFTVGLKDLRLTERLLREPDLTLRKAIKIGQAAKETKKTKKKTS